MKVTELLKQLGELNPNDDICVLYWEKPSYDYDDDDENRQIEYNCTSYQGASFYVDCDHVHDHDVYYHH